MILGNATPTQKGISVYYTNQRIRTSISNGISNDYIAVAGNTSLPQGEWSHIAIVGNGLTMVQYINGILDTDLSLANFSFPTGSNDYDFFIGGRNQAGSNNLPIQDAILDDVNIYDQPLSLQEIYELGDIDQGGAGTNGTTSNGTTIPQYKWALNNNVLDPQGSLDGYLLGGGITFGSDRASNASAALSFATNATGYVHLTGSKDDLSFLSNTATFSISFWFKPGGTNSQMLMGNGTPDQKGINIFYTNQTIRTSISNGISNDYVAVQGIMVLDVDQWHHVTITGDGQTIKQYVNGNSDGELPMSSFPFPTGPNNYDFFIGGRNQAGSNNFPMQNTSIDEIRIYNQPLAYSEIIALGELDTGGSSTTGTQNCGNIAAQYEWTLNNNTEDTQGGLNGYLLGTGASFGADRDANSSAALSFNASSDAYVQLVDSKDQLSFISNSAVFSASLWFKPGTNSSQMLMGNGTPNQKGINIFYNQQTIRTAISNGFANDYVTAQGAVILDVDQWHHIAVIGDGQSIKQYINGVLDGELDLSSFSFPSGQNDYDFFIGGRNQAGINNYPTQATSIDEVKIFNTSIPLSEVLTLSTSGPCQNSNNGSIWSLDEASSTIYYNNGPVSIGALYHDTNYQLAVKGKILTEGVTVKLYSNWPDYVFEPDFDLRPLSEVEAYIMAHKHLPEVPSAKEVKEKGQDIGDIQVTLLKKMEEMTLYMIEMKKEIELLKKENQVLKKIIKK